MNREFMRVMQSIGQVTSPGAFQPPTLCQDWVQEDFSQFEVPQQDANKPVRGSLSRTPKGTEKGRYTVTDTEEVEKGDATNTSIQGDTAINQGHKHTVSS